MSPTSALPPLLQAAPVAVAALDLQGRVIDANRALLAISGYTMDELRGVRFSSFVAAGGGASGGHFDSLVRGAIDWYQVERRYRTRSGEARDVDLSVSLVRDEAGAPSLCLAVLHDVTERKRTEAALELSEARYRALVEQAPLSIQILEPGGTTLQVNAAWERLWGATREQLGPYNMLEDAQLETLGIMPYIRRGFAGEAVVIPAVLYDPAETRPDLADGEDRRRWVSAVMYPLKDDRGRVREVVLIHEDITQKVRADQQRREATELLQAVVQQSGEAIVVADAAGVIRIFNAAAERLFGRLAAPTPPEHWTERYRSLREDGTPLRYEETALYRAVQGEPVRDYRWQMVRADGTTRHMIGTSAPLRTPDGQPAGAVLIARDETDRLAAEVERERMLVETRRAHRDVEAASRMKDEFLATLSHELRTPLNAILGWIRILRKRGTDPDARHALEVIERNALAQAHLVDDLLDVSRIITGKIGLQIEAVDLGPLASAAIETLRPAAEARGVRLEVQLQPGAPRVAGDPQRLQQVLWNLLSNAVKFTDADGVVTLSIAPDGRNVLVTVSDTGIGIAPGILPHVFDRFTQGDSSSTRTHAGLGLGLAIVRHLVELHGGTVSAESAGRGRGATFRVWIPAGAAPL